MSTSTQSLHSPDEEDLGWREPWYHSDDELDPYDVTTTNRSQYTKGKAKATRRQPTPTSTYPNGDTDELSHIPGQSSSAEAYPPTTEEDTDTRRVVEVGARALAMAHFSHT